MNEKPSRPPTIVSLMGQFQRGEITFLDLVSAYARIELEPYKVTAAPVGPEGQNKNCFVYFTYAHAHGKLTDEQYHRLRGMKKRPPKIPSREFRVG